MYLIFGLFLLACLFVVLYIIYTEIQDKKLLETVTKSYRGTRSERFLVLKLLKEGIPPVTIFHDLYIKKYNGTYCQIDLVVATKVGLIVFEVKDYGGWIFGNGNQYQWTQILGYGTVKHRFYNPIMQNAKHIEDLRKCNTQFENIPMYSVIVFYGNSIFKDIRFIPKDTFLIKPRHVMEVVNELMKENELARYINKREVVQILKKAVENGESIDIQNQHSANIRNMLSRMN